MINSLTTFIIVFVVLIETLIKYLSFFAWTALNNGNEHNVN